MIDCYIKYVLLDTSGDFRSDIHKEKPINQWKLSLRLIIKALKRCYLLVSISFLLCSYVNTTEHRYSVTLSIKQKYDILKKSFLTS